MNPKQILKAVVGTVVAIFLWIVIRNSFETLSANDIMVIQDPFSGKLSVYTEPGLKWQGWGKVTKYKRRGQYSFAMEVRGGDTTDNSKKLRFNDGGHANLNGAVSWEMPLDSKSIIAIHKDFGSAEAVQLYAVAKMIDNAVYLAGPLMSSTESSGERRSELVQYINDQAANGVYVTTVREKEVLDPLTGIKKLIAVTEIVRDGNGMPKRQQGSMLAEYNVTLLPMSISEIKYDKIVEDQISQRQQATTQVQIAQANAKRAEQDAITAEKQGEANAATAKWKQEVIKAQMVTEAEQNLAVQKLKTEQAAQYKQQQILEGEGDSEKKRLIMNANGALDVKLETYERVQKVWAAAFAAYPGNIVPLYMSGGGGTGGTNGFQQFMEMMMFKTAKDMSLDMSTKK